MTSQPRYLRKVTSASARLTGKDGLALLVTVKNQSSGGAKIEVDPDAAVPSEFHLEAAELELSADAVVVWRIGSHVGVRFLDITPEVAAPPAPPLDRRTVTIYRSSGFRG